MLARVVEGSDALGREVLGDHEGLGRRADAGERERAKVLLDVAHEGLADPLVVEHAPGDEGPDHRVVVSA